MDPAWGPKYPHLQRTRAYVASLPNGLDSYPECRSKGSIWKAILRATDTSSLAGRVPPELFALERDSLYDSAWMPMVQNFACHMVLRDCLFPADRMLAEHFRKINRDLFTGPLYRVLVALASPAMLIQAADRRFAALFQGIDIKVVMTGPNSARLTQTYPPDLVPALIGRMFLVGFEVAVELAGGKNLSGRVLEHGKTEARYELRWQ